MRTDISAVGYLILVSQLRAFYGNVFLKFEGKGWQAKFDHSVRNSLHTAIQLGEPIFCRVKTRETTKKESDGNITFEKVIDNKERILNHDENIDGIREAAGFQ